MKSNRILFCLLAAVIVSISIPSCHRRQIVEEPLPQQDTVYPLGFCTDSFDVIEGALRPGETFAALMSRLGVSSENASLLASRADTVIDLRRLKAGNSWQAYFEGDTNEIRAVKYLVYEESKVNTVIFQCFDTLRAWRFTKPVETTREFADVTINSSLWNDMKAAGVSPLLIVDLSEIYAWTIDFFGLQKGDRFRVIYDQESCDGDIIDVHKIYFADFEHDGKSYPAINYDQGDSGNVWWNEKGESLKRAFLKAPLKFTRISSGFSYHRKHPVTGQVRPHTAVDYAAPTGTPVMSIGDGTIISKGWAGGGGNTVKVRHNSVYTTSYMHLSRYAKGLSVGDRVHQGDVIGYVGATGTATGPHLDFRVYKNGSAVNPLKLEAPSAEPIKKENMAALDSTYNVLRAEMDSLTAKIDTLTN